MAMRSQRCVVNGEDEDVGDADGRPRNRRRKCRLCGCTIRSNRKVGSTMSIPHSKLDGPGWACLALGPALSFPWASLARGDCKQPGEPAQPPPPLAPAWLPLSAFRGAPRPPRPPVAPHSRVSRVPWIAKQAGRALHPCALPRRQPSHEPARSEQAARLSSSALRPVSARHFGSPTWRGVLPHPGFLLIVTWTNHDPSIDCAQ